MFPNLTGGNNNAKSSTQVNTKGLGGNNQFTGGGPIATQNLGGDSLTQMMRSLQNYQTTQGASTYGQGQGVTQAALPGFNVAGDSTGTAMGSTGTAMGSTGTAMDTTKQASAALDPAESYWTKLLSGDQATMNQAISPYANQAATNYGNAVTQVGQNMPRGGYSAALQSQMPFAQARDVNQQLYQLQPQAAAGLNTVAGTRGQIGGVQGQIAGTQGNIAGTQGNIAGVQGQIANWLASLGIDVSKLGSGLLQQGSDSLMTGRGQDVGEHGQAMQLAGTAMTDATKLADPFASAAAGNRTPTSDIRAKRNVVPYTDGLETVLQLNPIEYDYNGKGGTVDGMHYISVSAQEIQKVLPESVYLSPERLDPERSEKALCVDPSPVIWALVNAVKTLAAKVEQLERREGN